MSRPRKMGLLGLMLAQVFLLPLPGWGWGKTAHQIIEVAAIDFLPESDFKELLKNNESSLKGLCMVPDIRWKHGPGSNPLEGNSHFFELDFYGTDISALPRVFDVYFNKYGRKGILDHGSSPFRIEQLKIELINAMKKHDSTATLQMAAVLGHYVGDTGQPLHTTVDYDGKLSGFEGIHSYFETKSVDSYEWNELVQLTSTYATTAFDKLPEGIDALELSYITAKHSSDRVSAVYDLAKKYGLTEEFKKASKKLLKETMGQSIGSLARIWQDAWVEAGGPKLISEKIDGGNGFAPFPNWVPLSYMQ